MGGTGGYWFLAAAIALFRFGGSAMYGRKPPQVMYTGLAVLVLSIVVLSLTKS